jgi:hypothetical protein
VRQVDKQMSAATAPPRADPGPSAAAVPDWATAALKNPDDPRWVAVAAMRDGAFMAGIPRASATVIANPEAPPSAAQAASQRRAERMRSG